MDTYMAITPLPEPPSRGDSANFAQRGDAFMAALPPFAAEANALATDVNAKQGTASAAATTATEQAGVATTAAGSASSSASLSSTKAGEAFDSAAAALASKNAAGVSAGNAADSEAAAAASAATVDTKNLSTDYFGDVEPVITWPGMRWAHESAGVRKVRNAANDGWVVAGPIFPDTGARMRLFTVSGSFTGPPGVTLVFVSLCSGGGGGAAYASTSNGGAGGGGGSYAFKHAITITEGQVIPILVGAGGSGGQTSGVGNTGQAGGTTQFGTFITATGGGGGIGAGSGGIGGGGVNTRPGGRGGPHDLFGTNTCSPGGGNPFSGSMVPERGGLATAVGFGQGGAGAPSGGSSGGGGGAGYAGFCLVEW